MEGFNKMIPDRERYEKVQKELQSLEAEKKSLENRYDVLMQKVLSMNEVKQPAMEKLADQFAGQLLKLFMSAKTMELENQAILQKETVYRENVKMMRNKILEVLQSIE